MSEEKLKNVDVNNSDPMFVTGVLYGMMFGIEMVMDEKLPTNEEKNVIIDLINETVEHCGMKMSEMFKLIKEKNRVPDLMKVIEAKKEANEKMGLKKELSKAVDGILKCLKGGVDENK